MKRIITARLKFLGFKRLDPWIWRKDRSWACAYHINQSTRIHYLITVAFHTNGAVVEVLKSHLVIRLEGVNYDITDK